MYAAIRRGQIQPDAVEEVARRVQEGFVPLISQAPGFVAYYLVHSGNGAAVTVSIFEDQAGADESNRLAAEWVKQHLAPLLVSPLELTAGEVLVHHAR